MRDLIASELRKLTTTRLVYLLFAGVAALAVISVLDPGTGASTFERPFHEQTFLFFTSLLTRVVVLVMGIRAITDEFRHGTISSALVVTPRRGRLLAAKAVAVALTGAALAVTAWAVMAGAASVVAATEGATLRLDAGAWRSLGGTTLAGVAWGVIGLGIGAIVRSQIVAIVGGLVWLMGLEDAVRGWLGDLGTYLPGQSGLALAIAPSDRAAALGAATLTAYAVVAWVAATYAMRRDVT
ncbi:MAG TPA: ABC transporter permease [Actinomycetota bacterium]|nr:ABC transporter permease [Actinomycetota bacterium]